MARRILAVLLLAMAAGQLSDLMGFVDAVAGYQLGGRGVTWAFALTVLVAETLSGAGLLLRSGSGRQVGASLAVVVAAGWTVLGVQAFARGLVLDNCGCFGVHLAQPLRWWVLVEDVEFIALAWWVRRTQRSGRSAAVTGFPAGLSAIQPWRKSCPTITQPAPRADSTADSS